MLEEREYVNEKGDIEDLEEILIDYVKPYAFHLTFFFFLTYKHSI
jgi:hypothetical protein